MTSAERCNELSSSIVTVWDEIKDKYIRPCKMALNDCGIQGSYKAKIEELANTIEKKLLAICDNYGVISGNLDDFAKDIDGFTSAGRFNKALDAAESVNVTQTSKRGRKFEG